MTGRISRKEILRIWRYNPATGEFVWRIDPSTRVRAGDPAGSVHDHGYVVLRYKRKFYKAHRVAWFLVMGEWPERVDHKNLDRADNRFVNLRLATRSENAANSPKRANNSTGLKCAFLHKKTGKYQASIGVGGKQVYLGLFSTAEQANAAYAAAASRTFGEFARA